MRKKQRKQRTMLKIDRGGNNNPAPYETTHVRVPVPIKSQVEAQIREFKRRVQNRELVLSGGQVYFQMSFDNADTHKAALSVLENYSKYHAKVEESSPRNASLRNFRNWLEQEIKKAM